MLLHVDSVQLKPFHQLKLQYKTLELMIYEVLNIGIVGAPPVPSCSTGSGTFGRDKPEKNSFESPAHYSLKKSGNNLSLKVTHICSLFKPRSHCSLGQSYRGFANSWKVKLALKQENKAIVCSASRKMSNIYSHSLPRKMSQTEFFFKKFFSHSLSVPAHAVFVPLAMEVLPTFVTRPWEGNL